MKINNESTKRNLITLAPIAQTNLTIIHSEESNTKQTEDSGSPDVK